MKSPHLKFVIPLILVLFILSFAFLMRSGLGIFPQKMVGSFEYVRKGEALFDKGKYAQAIPYFEKAYESSPENEVIKSNLIYVYSTYSKMLSEKEKYDDAIDYLVKAYNVAPSSSAAQNLAIAYSSKALFEAQRGRVSKAHELYAKSRELASGAIGQNLSIVLYNDGVGEYRSGREDTAILCLKESVLVHKDTRTFELLGDLYYKRAELKSARIFWHEAKVLAPANASLSEKIRKLKGEISLEAKEKKTAIPHFEIIYKKDLPIDKQLITEILESAYADVGKDLGYFPKDRTKIFFYSKEDFGKIFRMPYMVRAFYDGSIKMPFQGSWPDEKGMARYIYHEYTHAIISAKTNNNCPAWFSEGIALWEESKQSHSVIEGFFAKIKSMPDVSMRFMNESFKTDTVTQDKALSYLLSYTLVNFILDKWGITGLQGVLKRLAEKQHIANAIDDEFLMSEKEFEKKWRGYALHKFFRDTLK